MTITQGKIRQWFEQGIADGAAHMVIMCDTFDYDDYPSYMGPDANFWFDFDLLRNSSMQKVMEVYDLGMDMEKQLKQPRAYNPPPRPEPLLAAVGEQPPLTPCEKCGCTLFDYWPLRKEQPLKCAKCKHPAEPRDGKVRSFTIKDSEPRS